MQREGNIIIDDNYLLLMVILLEVLTFHYCFHMLLNGAVVSEYNLGRPFLGYHYYILCLSDLCLGVKNKIFILKNNAFSLYDLYINAFSLYMTYMGTP